MLKVATTHKKVPNILGRRDTSLILFHQLLFTRLFHWSLQNTGRQNDMVTVGEVSKTKNEDENVMKETKLNQSCRIGNWIKCSLFSSLICLQKILSFLSTWSLSSSTGVLVSISPLLFESYFKAWWRKLVWVKRSPRILSIRDQHQYLSISIFIS